MTTIVKQSLPELITTGFRSMSASAELRLRGTQLSWLVYSAGSAFKGLPTHVDDPVTNSDPEAAPTPESPRTDNPVPQRSPVLITPNILARVFVIIWLSALGGFSLIPAEQRVPSTLSWVFSVIFIANIVAWTTAIDVLCPAHMKWYFRKPIPVPPVTCADATQALDTDIPLDSITNTIVNTTNQTESANNTIADEANDEPNNINAEASVGVQTKKGVHIDGVEVLGGLAMTGYIIVKLAFYQNDLGLGLEDFIYAVLVGIPLYWIKKLEPVEWSPCCYWAKHWLLYENYYKKEYIHGCGRGIYSFITIVFSWSSWWWIAYRLTSVVTVIRNRHDPLVKAQFILLICGMAGEATGIICFFLSYLICWALGLKWYKQLWMSHLLSTITMGVFWLAAIIIGFNTSAGASSMLLPCTGDGTQFCKALVTYVW
ncbi:hypothetical protein BDQ17DRAFT_1357218 [Cyathus striatus]|nr:hypothetical protein BDQ17DRAFT_1357218 [Cyathus striatus]